MSHGHDLLIEPLEQETSTETVYERLQVSFSQSSA